FWGADHIVCDKRSADAGRGESDSNEEGSQNKAAWVSWTWCRIDITEDEKGGRHQTRGREDHPAREFQISFGFKPCNPQHPARHRSRKAGEPAVRDFVGPCQQDTCSQDDE